MEQRENAQQWVYSPWLSFDTETTGVSPQDDRIVTASTVLQLGGMIDSEPASTVNWLANPGVPIPPRAAAVHGISTEYAREHGRAPSAVLEEINQALAVHVKVGGVIIVFNAGFDLPLLAADSMRHDVTPLSKRAPNFLVLDPLVLDRALVPRRRGKRTLGDLCNAYGVRIGGRQHDADVDAEATLRLAQTMVEKYPRLQEMSAPELSQFQRASHAAWAQDFERWLRGQGRQTRISTTWY